MNKLTYKKRSGEKRMRGLASDQSKQFFKNITYQHSYISTIIICVVSLCFLGKTASLATSNSLICGMPPIKINIIRPKCYHPIQDGRHFPSKPLFNSLGLVISQPPPPPPPCSNKARAQTWKLFKEPRNWSPPWRAGTTTTLFDLQACYASLCNLVGWYDNPICRTGIDSLELIPWNRFGAP